MISEADARWEIHETLKEKGFRHVGPGADQYRGFITAGHVKAEIELNIPDLRFTALPTIHFVDRAAFSTSMMAHLEQGTGVCYADDALLRLDPEAPGASILRVLIETENTIRKSQNQSGRREIAAEYSRYWAGDKIFVFGGLVEQGKAAKLALGKRTDQRLLLAANENPPAGFRDGRTVTVFRTSEPIGPMADWIYPRTLAQLQAWCAQHEWESSDVFDSALSALSREEIIFFAAPNSWVGCQAILPGGIKALVATGKARPDVIFKMVRNKIEDIDLLRYYGVRADLDFVTMRNIEGKQSPLRDKKIAVIGCGTIGSHLARQLVQTGAGNRGELLLVDQEILATGNLGRHILNFDDVGRPKASALADDLRRFHPDLSIRAIDADAISRWSEYADYDLIIDCTGVEVVSEQLNRLALTRRLSGDRCNLVHAWLFGNGVAAQAFLNAGDGFACYRCLRPELDRPWLSDPRKDVKDGGDIVFGPCGEGAYVPYAVDAPIIAAALGLQMTMDFFGDKPRHRLRTRVIDKERALHKNDRSPKPHDRCPACNGNPGSGSP